MPTELTVDVVGIATAEAAHPRREDLDPLWGDVVLERAAATRVRTRRGFNALHNDAIVAGLQRREGSWLVPALVVDADKQLADYVLFQSMFVIGRAVGRDEERQLPEEIRICRGCTLVFRPTRSDQMACRLCSKKRPPPGVLGLLGPLQEPCDRLRVRAHRTEGRAVVGWRDVTIGLCARCGEPFHGRRDKRTCGNCAGAVRQQRHRRRGQV